MRANASHAQSVYFRESPRGRAQMHIPKAPVWPPISQTGQARKPWQNNNL